MSFMRTLVHLLLQVLRSLVIIILLFLRQGLWELAAFSLVPSFQSYRQRCPYRSLVLPTASLTESLDHARSFTTTRSDHQRKKQSFSKNRPLVLLSVSCEGKMNEMWSIALTIIKVDFKVRRILCINIKYYICLP